MLLKRDFAFFGAAKEMSKLSDYKKHKIGCVITYKNRIISSSSNSTKTNPLQQKYNKLRFEDVGTPHSVHAETAALLPLLKRDDIDWPHVHIYLFRQHANETLAISRPCASCMAMLKDFGIKHIYYTNEGSYCEEHLM